MDERVPAWMLSLAEWALANHCDFSSFDRELTDCEASALIDYVDPWTPPKNNDQHILSCMERLVNLKHMDLSHRQLTSLPDSLRYLTQLKEIDLRANGLREIPEYFTEFMHLKKLTLAKNRLDSWSFINSLNQLEYLNLADNHLKTFPCLDASQSSIITLILDQNEINSIPQIITEFKALSHISLTHNLVMDMEIISTKPSHAISIFLDDQKIIIDEVDLSVQKLTDHRSLSAYQLSLYHDWVKRLYDWADKNAISGPVPLNDLHFSYRPKSHADYFNEDDWINVLMAVLSEPIPKDIDQLLELTRLELYNFQLTDLTADISYLMAVETINLTHNQLKQLPDSLHQLVNLKELSLAENEFSCIPDVVFKMKRLEVLNCRDIHLSSLPKELFQLTSLKKLYLSDNPISELPKDIANLIHLEELDISNSGLTKLPEEILLLPNLKVLIVAHNQLTELPHTFARLTKLAYLDISDNGVTEFPNVQGCAKLSDLFMDNNDIAYLPVWASQLPNLKSLTFTNINTSHKNPYRFSFR